MKRCSLLQRSIYAVLFIVFLCSVSAVSFAKDDQAERERFNQLCHQWQNGTGEWLLEPENQIKSSLAAPDAFYVFVDAVRPWGAPYLVEMMDQDLNSRKWDNRQRADISSALRYVTGKRFLWDEWPEGKPGNNEDHMRLFVNWWKEGRKDNALEFNKRYARYKQALAQGASRDSALNPVEAMGYDALPFLMKKIEAGETELLPAVNDIIDMKNPVDFTDLTGTQKDKHKTFKDNESKNAVLKWWKDNKKHFILPESKTATTESGGKD